MPSIEVPLMSPMTLNRFEEVTSAPLVSMGRGVRRIGGQVNVVAASATHSFIIPVSNEF